MSGRPINLLNFTRKGYSQNGEEGMIEKIFSIIGTTNKFACEFGAWDGMYFSNTRKLLLSGWGGLLIEPDKERFKELVENSKFNRKIVCLKEFVDDKKNNLEAIFKRLNLPPDPDLLSIDVDGLDYYIFKSMGIQPRVVVVEAGAHNPEATTLIEKAKARDDIGQPLGAFCVEAEEQGYRLICFLGNAYFLREDMGFEDVLPTLSPRQAYLNYLNHRPLEGRRWMYRVNKGWVPPYFKYHNKFLSPGFLRLSVTDVMSIWFDYYWPKIRGKVRLRSRLKGYVRSILRVLRSKRVVKI